MYAIKAVSSQAPRQCPAAELTADVVVGEALCALRTKTVGTHEQVVCEAISALVFERVLVKAQQAFDLVCTTTRSPTKALHIFLDDPHRIQEHIQEALREVGVYLPDLSPTSLTRHARRLAVRATVEFLPLWDCLVSLHSGHLLGQLTATYEATINSGTAADAAMALTGCGWDGEAIADSVIHFETLHHLGLVWMESNKMARRLPDVVPAALFTWGWHGLRLALRNYDPTRNQFSTYACYRIKGAIRDGVRADGTIPKRLTTLKRKVAKAEEELGQQLGRTPSLQEVALAIEESLEVLRLVPRLQTEASLDQMMGPWSERSEPQCLVDDTDPADQAVLALRQQAIVSALATLPDDEELAVRLLVLEERSPAEAAACTGVQPRQLRLRRDRGLQKLALALEEWSHP